MKLPFICKLYKKEMSVEQKCAPFKNTDCFLTYSQIQSQLLLSAPQISVQNLKALDMTVKL